MGSADVANYLASVLYSPVVEATAGGSSNQNIQSRIEKPYLEYPQG
jgi:hypothetical protein